jgi:hypothetical protein
MMVGWFYKHSLICISAGMVGGAVVKFIIIIKYGRVKVALFKGWYFKLVVEVKTIKRCW